MNLTLYQLSGCDDYKINKASYLTQKYLLQGDIKENCDISNPILNIQCPKDAYTNNDFNFNYCYIAEFDRYYFINSITFGLGNIITIGCSVDVLYSFSRSSEGWLISNLYCTRRTNGSRLVEDTLRSFKYEKEVTDVTSSIPVVAESPFVVFDVSNSSKTDRRVVIAVINDADWSTDAPISDTKSALGRLPSLNRYSNGDMMVTTYYLLTFNSLNGLLNLIYNNDTIKSYIKSITILPYQPESVDLIDPDEEHPQGRTFNTIHIGSSIYTMRDNVGYVKYQNYDRFIKEKRTFPSASSFMDYRPYTTYKWYVPYKDYVELDLESIYGCTLSLLYYVNFDDSSSQVIIYNDTKDKIEYQAPCQLGVKLGISATNQLEINNQSIQMSVQTGISTIAGILAIIGGVASGNALMVAGGTTSIVGGVASGVAKASAMHVLGQTAIGSGYAGIVNAQTSQIIKIKQVPLFTDGSTSYTNYVNDKGIPYNNYLTINSLSNDEFAIIDDDNIPLIPRATKNEFNTLKELLKQGIRK